MSDEERIELIESLKLLRTAIDKIQEIVNKG